jgi:hypothetical protein
MHVNEPVLCVAVEPGSMQTQLQIAYQAVPAHMCMLRVAMTI